MLNRLTTNNAEIGRHAARARMAAQRIDAQEPISADNSGRLQGDALRLESTTPIGLLSHQTGARTQRNTDTSGILGNRVSNLFFVQRFAQEQFPDNRPAVAPEVAASAYPSLAFDNDILLPGQAVPVDWYGNSRLDIRL